MADINVTITQGGQINVTTQSTQWPAGAKGEKWDIGLTGKSAYQAWLDLWNIGTESDFISSLKGAKGDKGETGAQGPQGIQGATGPQWPQGTQGPMGYKGNTGNDGKSAYEVAVAQGFIGTITEWLASLIWPKGDKGDTGAQGVQGIQGIQGEKWETGATGPQGLKWDVGQSAYEAWLALGNIGTMQDFINSIKWAKWDKGDTGATGATGPQWLQGIQWETGATWPTGATGAQWPQGIQGIKGDTGAGVVVGGTTGQVLAKLSNTNFDTHWIDPPSGSSADIDGISPQVLAGLRMNFKATVINDSNGNPTDILETEIGTLNRKRRQLFAYSGELVQTQDIKIFDASSAFLYGIRKTFTYEGENIVATSITTLSS